MISDHASPPQLADSASPPVVFLMGATATGKTDLAARLYDAFAAELVSVDAAQVYRGMDIGTAKPKAAFLRQYPHHLIDIRAPHESYSAAQFCAHARTLIGEIHARGNLPILVGGTLFYFSALENGLSELPSADADLRARLAREVAQHGLAKLYAQLQKVDASLAATIAPTDAQRIQRAVEIHQLTGQPPSNVMARAARRPLPFPLLKLGLSVAPRSLLHARIEERFRHMLARGLVEETQAIAAAMENPHAQTSLRAVGYRQVLAFLRGECAYADMVEKGIAATRQLAKRQLTWLRGWGNLVWLDNTDFSAADAGVERVQHWLVARRA